MGVRTAVPSNPILHATGQTFNHVPQQMKKEMPATSGVARASAFL